VIGNPDATNDEAETALAALTAAKAGLQAASAEAVSKASLPKVKVTKVAITGTAKVGAKLRAKVSGKTSGTEVSYSWYRGATKIAGADGAAYKLTKADKGKKIRVKVKLTKSGFKATAKVSAARKVR
jgi:hypothetical protein